MDDLRDAIDADRPRFAVHEPVSRRDGGWFAEPDLSLPAVRLALEYQGADRADITRPEIRGLVTARKCAVATR